VGAQIFFKNSTRIHHTGWVTKVKDGIVYTVEGNTNSGPYVIANGGQVRQKSYWATDTAIAGYGFPAYEEETVTYPTWIKSGDNWYYRLSEGVNAHGFKDIKASDGNTYRYYFDTTGKMLTGWQMINSKWYFFHDNPSSGLVGALYVTDADGVQTVGKF
jgi:glucan-binding YG repeat protein